MGSKSLARGAPGARPRVAAVIVGAGRSRRMGARVPKPFLRLGGEPIYLHALERLAGLSAIRETILVLPKASCRGIECRLAPRRRALKLRAVVPGGRRRQDSVLRGIEATSPGCTLVAVHDAARPLVDPSDVRRAIRLAAACGAAILAVPLRDTVKRQGPGDRVAATLPRDGLWAAQTPQIFRREILLAALRRAREDGVEVTDDAAAVERMGVAVRLAPGRETNFKVTTPEDLRRARDLVAGARRKTPERKVPVRKTPARKTAGRERQGERR